MDQSNRTRTEAWLRYADDLGLGPYYRDRAGQALSPQPAQPEACAPAAPAASSSSEVTAARPGRMEPPAQKPSPAPAFVPSVTGPSLFEAAERIEGDTLERIRADIGPNCTRCKLHRSRTNIVFGVGNPKAELVFVGEGPGRDEDEQ
ncbi:MAG TPA: hypothetical protein VNM68_05435, partial [Candidatus Polarisedimenticolia bacterium]|nr:hypothetical protein [Candidatus Polarisedimenticolia bacterium]